MRTLFTRIWDYLKQKYVLYYNLYSIDIKSHHYSLDRLAFAPAFDLEFYRKNSESWIRSWIFSVIAKVSKIESAFHGNYQGECISDRVTCGSVTV